MQLVDIYKYLILFIVLLFTFQQTRCYTSNSISLGLVNVKRHDYIGLLLCVFLTFLIGLRPMENNLNYMWADSAYYYRGYNFIEGSAFEFSFDLYEILWTNLFNYIASNRLGISTLFVICDALYFGCAYAACKKWFPHDTLSAYLVFLGAFSTYSYSFNGIRAGVASSIFLLAIAYYENRFISVVLVLVSWGFHHSMQMPVAAYILTLFYKNPKWYFYGWGICVLLALMHVSYFQNLFMGVTDEHGASYLQGTGGNSDGTVGGFRIDFLLYSAMPVLIGYKIVIKEKIKVSRQYSVLLHMYLCTNAIWMLCMYAEFTNRIAYLSWFLYPIVLIYPFLKEDLHGMSLLGSNNQYTMYSKVMKYHLFFTLFMALVFYKLIK